MDRDRRLAHASLACLCYLRFVEEPAYRRGLEGLRAHTHHGPGAGSACIACHMPRKNLGLAYELTRYHRIGSPTDEARVLGDRPRAGEHR